MARLPDAAREFAWLVQKVDRCKIIRTADIVLPTLAGSKENAGITAERRLGRLHVEMIGVQGDFAANGYPSFVGSKIESIRREAEGVSQLLELVAGPRMEEVFGSVIVGNGLSEIESLGRLGHVGTPESG